MTPTPSPTIPNQILSKPSYLITKCEDLIFEIFIQIFCDGDHTRLGEGDTELAWDNIRSEYNQLTGGLAYAKSITLLRDINFLSAKLQVVEQVTDMMRIYYLPELGEILSEYSLKYTWENIPEEQYQKQIEAVISKSKTWYIQLIAKKKEWDDQQAAPDDKKIDRSYFEEWMIALSQEYGYNVKSTEISTYRFGLMVKRVTEDVRHKK
jgi:hypothetical protein